MDTKRVPDLDWPADLFRHSWALAAIEDPDNPFLEDADFELANQLTERPRPVLRHEPAMTA